MKICHVITRMIVGGAQENTLLSIKGQLEAGHQSVLVTGRSPGREGELLKKMAMPSFRIELMPDLVRELSPLHDLAAYWKLRRFFRREKFDVVHTHSSKAGIIGRLAAAAAGVPVVVHTVHGQAFHRYEKWWRNRIYVALERLAASRSDRIFAVAQAMIDQCVAANVAPRDRYQVIYSGMDTSALSGVKRDAELRRRLELRPEDRVIVTVARLFPLKGYEFVFPAAERIIKEFPDTRLLVVGDGPKYDDFQTELRRRGIAHAVRFAGLVPPERVKDYLAQGDLLWHLSLREGLPRAVVQALAAGLPAVGFALDGTPEVILPGKTGFLAEAGNVDQVVEATRKLWLDPELGAAMGRNGQQLVVPRFDWRKMVDDLESAYRELLAASGR